jgi:hypothetical protein
VIEVDVATRFLVLHALTVKGVAGEDALIDATGLPADDVREETARLLAAELVRQRKGRIGGFALLDAGKAAHAELLAGNVDDAATQALDSAYRGFLPVNGRFKSLCTRWQLRTVDGSSVPNDHSDAEHDSAVVADLVLLHKEAVEVLTPAGAALPRFARYPRRLTAALERLRAGEIAAFTKPLSASYHDVWMELHQDLLTSLGRTRDDRDEG